MAQATAPPDKVTATSATRTTEPSSRHLGRRLLLAWLGMAAVKILLHSDAYFSTDLYVHRHWKALTRQLPAALWYFDDEFVNTRHTLDYPPGFAMLEAFWSNVLPPEVWPTWWWHFWSHQNVVNDDDGRAPLCLQLLPSSDDQRMLTDVDLVGEDSVCLIYLRWTVLLGDVVLWWGAWQVATMTQGPSKTPWGLFLLLVLHPALLWLDHVHFQYNGLLLGLWMLSLASLLRGRPCSHSRDYAVHVWHGAAAVSFALLLTLKHLYLPLALWYTAYLLRRYCYTADGQRFLWRRLLVLGVGTLVTLGLPFAVIVWPDLVHTRGERLVRIFQRLFPFGRGLVHDYWAGNVWALYMVGDKISRAVLGLAWPTVSPLVAACVLLVAVVPGAVGAWTAAHDHTSRGVRLFWSSLSYTALASFMTAYHGHEKAILTSLVPLLCWAAYDPTIGSLVWRTHALALTSLLPLLFPATETALKLVSLVAYLAVLYDRLVVEGDKARPWDRWANRGTLVVVTVTMLVLEGVPVRWWGRYTFLPLAWASLVTAVGLLLTWTHVGSLLWKDVWPTIKETNESTSVTVETK
jgi:alpha-1,3-glucosyltransferase